MLVQIHVAPLDAGWRVQLRDAGGQPLNTGGVHPERTLPRLGDFPLPPPDEAQALPADAVHRALCTADDPQVLHDALYAILDRAIGPDDAARFGRYLFATLIGDAWWQAILAQAGDAPLELALAWPADDAALNRLPWEMMYADTAFIAFRNGLALTRRVASAVPFDNRVAVAPRVLFVMGTGLDDDVIRPGAEYMGMVRNLSVASLGGRLQTQVLVQATTEKLERAIEGFRPTVVHFICHGWFDDQRAFLELYDPDSNARTKAVYADNLLTLLKRDDGTLPPVVVLSACHTASVRTLSARGEPAMPLAGELIAGGIPIVVGMAGRITDLACRLFTRRFYEALLTEKNVAVAVAEGRQSAQAHGGYDPHREIDWAFPALYLAGNVDEPRICFSRDPWGDVGASAAGEYRHGAFPPFCDRLRIMERHDLILSDADTQRAVFHTPELQVLAYASETGLDEHEEGKRYGRTWQLKDLAVRAAHEGHVPCLVVNQELNPGGQWPTTLEELIDLIDLAMEVTAVHYDLLPHSNIAKRVAALPDGAPPPDDLPDEIRTNWSRPRAQRIARALRHDLLALLDRARGQIQDPARRPRTRLVLLVDDLHRMSEDAVAGFLHDVLGPFGLRQARDDVRIAFTFAQKGKQAWVSSQKAIVDWLGQKTWAEHVLLGPFQAGLEERLAYQRLLFNWREGGELKRLTTVGETGAARDFVESFFANLAESIGGIPSQMTEKAEPIIRVFERLPVQVLRVANDDETFQLDPGGRP